MFGHRFFAARMYGQRYFGPGVTVVAAFVRPQGGKLKHYPPYTPDFIEEIKKQKPVIPVIPELLLDQPIAETYSFPKLLDSLAIIQTDAILNEQRKIAIDRENQKVIAMLLLDL